MSGGVDSSVTAALLKEQGYSVTGVYMKNWTEDIAGFECPWTEDYRDAKCVATKLGIDFKVFDFQKEYRQKVVDYMIDEYKAGRTPNPDIMCNQEVKFKLFLNTALEQGADMIATGHYAQVVRVKNQESRVKQENVRGLTFHSELHVAADKNKDQTYFLARVTGEALSKTLFPIGEFDSKEEVRELAKKFGLPTAEKKDSQGICFVGQVGIKEFLSHYIKAEPGPIINHSLSSEGETIGEHEGAIFYTIGQRHGLNLGGGLPYYVTRKDMSNNTVYVTTDLSDKELWSKEIQLGDLHWIDNIENEERRMKNEKAEKLRARLRYRGPLIDCELKGNKLTLKDEQRAIASGQSAVFYAGDQCLGGGIISSVI
ncbi:tRNA 2-thiouridine(34) synthase MnmA [Candidatus Parcubacteria bacterium]|nr:tRNA 2-thiouridine(34) synthase MnmA [Candidatus Parcubacteria bacterium]